MPDTTPTPPTIEELAQDLAALAGRVAALEAKAPAVAPPAVPWFRQSYTRPTEPLADLSNEDELKRFASFGLRPNLSRGVAPQDLEARKQLCDELWKATSYAQQGSILAGADAQGTDVACFLVLEGGAQGFGPFMEPRLFAPRAFASIADAATWIAGIQNPDGPGPGVQE